MDYTTVANVTAALHITDPTGGTDAALLGRIVTAASRLMDRVCTGSMRAVDYFKLEAVANEELAAVVTRNGQILCYPRKAVVQFGSITAFGYRSTPFQDFNMMPDTTKVEITGPHHLRAWASFYSRPTTMRALVSYTGGLSVDIPGLPADFVELVTLIAGRIYREDEAGLTDAVGIATLGSVVYTKALPERFEELSQPYKRKVAFE